MKSEQNDILFTPDYVQLLTRLLEINTISPMETGLPSSIGEAQELYADFAQKRLGCEIVYHSPPSAEDMDAPAVPLSVQECAARMGPLFWDSQPNLVLRLGPERPVEDTLMFNFHMDTVDGVLPILFDGEKFHGRGAVDMKGPGAALLAGIEAALKKDPALTEKFSILVQCVSGEEGGAMGVYGTKLLTDQGFLGGLNLFAEPTAGVYFDQSTTSMTARITVQGLDATDDAPHEGHNATLLLGYLAHQLMKKLSGPVAEEGGKMCIAGVHTGSMHNRVYGTGSLLINFAYASTDSGQRIRDFVNGTFLRLIEQFQVELGGYPLSRTTAEAASEICKLTWLKQGLPVLNNRHEVLEGFLATLGWKRNPQERAEHAFTCDAMWAQREDVYTIVYGPGSLSGNMAHAEGEFILLSELEQYSADIERVLTAMGERKRSEVLEESGSR